MEKAARTGREPDRVALTGTSGPPRRPPGPRRGSSPPSRPRRPGLAAAFRGPPGRGHRVRRRPGPRPGAARSGIGGGKLAADLTLPKLRRRWAGPRLTGRGMGGPTARAVLAREALRAARAARTEPEFFALLSGPGCRSGCGPPRTAGPAAAAGTSRCPAWQTGPGGPCGSGAAPWTGPAARPAARPLAGGAARRRARPRPLHRAARARSTSTRPGPPPAARELRRAAPGGPTPPGLPPTC